MPNRPTPPLAAILEARAGLEATEAAAGSPVGGAAPGGSAPRADTSAAAASSATRSTTASTTPSTTSTATATAGAGTAAAGDAAAVPPAAPTLPARPEPPWAVAIHRSSLALVVLATLSTLYAIHVAKDFLVPLVLSITLAYLLDPLVAVLERRRVPRGLGAALVVVALVGAIGWGAWLLQGQIESIIDRLPAMATKLARSIGALLSGDDSMVQKIRRAAAVLNTVGQGPPARGAPAAAAPDVVNSIMLAGSMSAFAALGQAAVVLFLTFFLLVSGDIFKRKFVKMSGRTLRQKKINVHMLDEINKSIQRYMGTLVITNAILGVCTYAMLKWLGLDNAGTWSVVSAALHVIPYFGSVITAVCLGLAAFMQFGTLSMAATAAGGTMIIATVIGMLVTTWMTGRMAKMNAVAVFVALLLFTWLWGTWGLLLAIPIAVIVKVVADHIEGLEVLAEFLGE